MSNSAAPGLSRKLDQFYTLPAYAQQFYSQVASVLDLSRADILLEPSAGAGSFYDLMDPARRIGLDLDPQAPGIVQQDFFTWTAQPGQCVYTVGNPPFGKNASLAVKFFNHAARFSDAIAFVLPRTFRKASIQNRLDTRFHLVYDQIVPPNSFLFEGQPYDVWCCAQIWVKKSTRRKKISIPTLSQVKSWFEIVDATQADFAIQRVGGRAGQIRTKDFGSYSRLSHYFIKQKDSRVLDIFKAVDFEPVKFNTAGNPSISPGELVGLWRAQAEAQGIDLEQALLDHKYPGLKNLQG